MITVEEVPPLRTFVREARARGASIGFVPTMGALHEGHLSLVRLAHRHTELVAVSVFVNPLQFGPAEDYSRYPRRPEEDAALLDAAGVDLLYLPRPDQFYPPDFSTFVEVRGISEGGEGAIRPGHFRGVATVVSRLFLQVAPDAAFFGRKDLQQVAVVRRLIRDLDFPIRLVAGETVREPDGLALSSRNVYLSPEDRRKAPALFRTLSAAREKARGGFRDAISLAGQARADLERAGLAVEYLEIVDEATMSPAAAVERGTAMTAAVRLGKTRLIDNVALLDA